MIFTLKRFIAAGLVLVVLLFMVTASASTVGSSTNPLVSRSYLEGTFAASLRAEIAKTLNDAAESAMIRLDEIYTSKKGYNFAPGFTRVTFMDGSALMLSSGGSFILLAGSATVNVTRGVVINISTGMAVASGASMAINQRYFCTEDTTARITTGSAATGQVDGYFFVGGNSLSATHLPFLDIPGNAWFFEAIDYVYQGRYFSGTSATTFSPGTPMTRAMFVTVLHRLAGIPAVGSGSEFSDIKDPSQYYYNAVRWANNNGIVSGYDDGTFRPDSYVTREQMAAIIYRYAAYKGGDTSVSGSAYDTFPDKEEVSDYAVRALRWAVSREIIRGSGGMLLPHNSATRAEVAQIIYNYCIKG